MNRKVLNLSVQIGSKVAPRTLANWASNMFLTPRQSKSKEKESLPTPHFEISIKGAYLRRWGNQDKKIFLLHGWEGRYTQFYSLIPALREAGFSVVTIDPPGHGRAGGKRSNPRLFADALLAAADYMGSPAAVVGHSMGGAAAMLAIRDGLRVDAAVFISAPSNVRSVIASFGDFLGLGKQSAGFLNSNIEAEVGVPIDELNVVNLVKEMAPPPVLVVHDTKDIYIPVSHAEKIYQIWPGAKIVFSSGLGHQRLLSDSLLISQVVCFLSGKLHMPSQLRTHCEEEVNSPLKMAYS